MFDKEKVFNIDDIYFALCGCRETVNKKSDKEILPKKTKIFKPITYVCFKVYANKDGGLILKDVLNNNTLLNGDEENEEFCILPKSVKSARKLFKYSGFKIIDENTIKDVIDDLNKVAEERNPKNYLYELCKLNNIKIIQDKNLKDEKNIEKTM